MEYCHLKIDIIIEMKENEPADVYGYTRLRDALVYGIDSQGFVLLEVNRHDSEGLSWMLMKKEV